MNELCDNSLHDFRSTFVLVVVSALIYSQIHVDGSTLLRYSYCRFQLRPVTSAIFASRVACDKVRETCGSLARKNYDQSLQIMLVIVNITRWSLPKLPCAYWHNWMWDLLRLAWFLLEACTRVPSYLPLLVAYTTYLLLQTRQRIKIKYEQWPRRDCHGLQAIEAKMSQFWGSISLCRKQNAALQTFFAPTARS